MIVKRKRIAQHFYADPGSKERELFIMDGDHLINAGFEDTQALINSYRDSTDINLVLSRITEEEYDRIVNSRRVYMDTTSFPQTLADIKNQYRDSEFLYNGLPDDVKKELGSLSKFSKMSDDEFAEFIQKHIPSKSDDTNIESEVIE